MGEITIDKMRKIWRSRSETDRRQRVAELMQIYSSDWSDLLDNELRRLFLPQNYEKLSLRADTSMNILKWATDTLGAIYSRPVSREIEGDAGPWERFRDLDLAFDGACRLLYICREIFVRPIIMDDGSVIIDVMTPDRAIVIPSRDNPWGIEALLYSVDDGKRFILWTSESHVQLTNEFERIPQPNNPEEINPYGVIPWLLFHAKYPIQGQVFNDLESESLKQATFATGIAKTDHAHLRHLQSFKQMVFTGMTDDSAVRAMVDPATAITIKNPNAGVEVLDMQADLQTHLATILESAAATLNLLGIRPEMVRGTLAASSGYALSIMMHETERAWEQQRQLWRVYEQTLYDLAAHILEIETGQSLPGGEVLVTFGDLRPANSPHEEAKYYIDLVNNNMLSRRTAMMRMLDMNDQQVDEELNQIIFETSQLSPLKIPPMPDSPELQGLSQMDGPGEIAEIDEDEESLDNFEVN